jgi:hypothetical protein
MANSVDFYKHKTKQQILCSKESIDYSVDFMRDGNTLFYGFNGFGDLMGLHIYARAGKYILAENRIGIFDEVNLYLRNPLERDFRVIIRETPEPRDNY